MDTASSHTSGPTRHSHGAAAPDLVQMLPIGELDRRIQVGWVEWCELLDGLSHTDGMLPSRELAGRVLAFFEGDYWLAEDARIEALRRQLRAEATRRCRDPERSWSIGGR